jgi:hypothetical protein
LPRSGAFAILLGAAACAEFSDRHHYRAYGASALRLDFSQPHSHNGAGMNAEIAEITGH